MSNIAPPPGAWPVSNVSQRMPPPGATCQEASSLSHNTYIPCGRPAAFVVKNSDPSPYAMCAACADHNVRNRGARYQLSNETDALFIPNSEIWPVTNAGPFAQRSETTTAAPTIPPAILARLKLARLSQDNDGMLMLWQQSKAAIQDAKDDEMMLRKLCVHVMVPDAEEGMNNVDLGEGYTLKAGIKYNYRLKAPVGYTGDTVDAVDDVIDNFSKISNEGAFIAERLFTWKVDMSLTEYRKLLAEAETSEVKKQLLDELRKVLEISDAAPTLEIKEPKGKK